MKYRGEGRMTWKETTNKSYKIEYSLQEYYDSMLVCMVNLYVYL